MKQLDMHEFENDAIRKANLIKEGKRKAATNVIITTTGIILENFL